MGCGEGCLQVVRGRVRVHHLTARSESLNYWFRCAQRLFVHPTLNRCTQHSQSQITQHGRAAHRRTNSPCSTRTAMAPSPPRSSAPSCAPWGRTRPRPSSRINEVGADGPSQFPPIQYGTIGAYGLPLLSVQSQGAALALDKTKEPLTTPRFVFA